MADPSQEDIRLVYGTHHHDVWWYKTQQWSAAGWALALLGGVVGAAQVLKPAGEGAFPRPWAFASLAILIGVAAHAYLARLHYDSVHARKVIEDVQNLLPSLNALVKGLPGYAASPPDSVRGAAFAAVLMAAISFVLGITVFILVREGWSAFIVALAAFLVGLGFLAFARRWAAAA